jgi:hypothetical protein
LILNKAYYLPIKVSLIKNVLHFFFLVLFSTFLRQVATPQKRGHAVKKFKIRKLPALRRHPLSSAEAYMKFLVREK